MMNKIKRAIALLLCLVLSAGLCLSAFAADEGDTRVTLGADLSQEDIAEVYRLFGVNRGDVPEMIVTNADERAYLSGVVSESAIGTRAISCTYLEVLGRGNNITVETKNITYCTASMYISALATAGITDAKVIVAAPFEVSGTAALTGIYKAYEVITGEKLDETAKEVSSQELAVTADLAQEIGDADSVEIVNQLKLILDETVKMTDDELRQQIIDIAANYDVSLTESQISQLIKLVRSLEKLDTNALLEKVRSVQDTLKQFLNLSEKAEGFTGAVQSFFQKVGETARNVWDYIVGIFKK